MSVPRFKVWSIGADGEPDHLILRTGSNERSVQDADFAGTTPKEAVALARERAGMYWPYRRVLVKNFDTGAWYTVHVEPSGLRVVEGKNAK